MKSREDISFSNTATVNLFECLVISGSPATGYLHAASFRDVRALQMSLQLLRDMWTRVDGLYIPQSDLESLHAMECKTAGSYATEIPACIATDTRKLARYYVYLLFRYCVSSSEHSSHGVRSHATPMLRLTDIPVPWMQTVAATNYPSAPPMITQPDSYRQQHQINERPLVQQQGQMSYATHHAPQDRLGQNGGGPPRHAQQLHHSVPSQMRVLNHMVNNRDQHMQLNSGLYPELPPSNPPNTEKRITKRRVAGAYRSAAESEED